MKTYDYDAGTVRINPPTAPATPATPIVPAFDQRLDGRLYMPSGAAAEEAGPFPLVVMIHARHANCMGPEGKEYYVPADAEYKFVPCEDDPEAGTSRLRTYLGYDYFARPLARHGIAVVSIDVSDQASVDRHIEDSGDSSGRLATAFATLDVLRRYDTGLTATAPIGDALFGKLDFSRLGIAGHSRGGAAAINAVRDGAARGSAGLTAYRFKAVMAIAAGAGSANTGPDGHRLPAASEEWSRVVDVPFAGISGDCDGDGSDIGFGAFARSKYADPADDAPKYYWRIAGANHNFWNSTLTTDDANNSYWYEEEAAKDVACSSVAKNNLRLSRPDQVRVGAAYVTGFFRRFLNDERSLENFLDGNEPLPAEVCPQTSGRPCDEIVDTSYIPPASQRQLVLEPGKVEPLTSAVGGSPITTKGLDVYDWCQPEGTIPDGLSVSSGKAPTNLAIYAIRNCSTRPPEYDPNSSTQTNEYIQSTDRQLEIAWSRPSSLEISLAPNMQDVSRFGSLRMRAFANYLSPDSPQPDRSDPVGAPAVKADFTVTLTDAGGRSATVDAGDYAASALDVPFRRLPAAENPEYNLIKLTLGGLKIPLSAFSGIDLSHVTSLELGFGGSTAPTGAIHLADVMFDVSGNVPPAEAAGTGNQVGGEAPAKGGEAPAKPVSTVTTGTRSGRFALASKRLRLDAKRRILLALSCTGEQSCGVRVQLKSGKRSVGSVAKTLSSGRTTVVKLKLTQKELRVVRKAGRLNVTVSPVGPSAGKRFRKVLALKK